MSHPAIVTDLNKCVGCLACSVACKAFNGVPIGSFWNKTLRIGPYPTAEGSGHFPDVYTYFLTVQCQHCADPECVKVCPTGASHIAADGTVQIDKSKCIGCQFCAMACPYGVRAYDTGKDKGVIEKCTMCAHLIDKGEKPACVKHCPGQARKFGDLDDPESDVSKLRAAKKTYKLKDVGNHPGGDYAMDKCAWKGDE